MPRYYFHLFNDITVLDEEGEELPNDAVALQRAKATVRAMAAENVAEGHLVLRHRIEVQNDHRKTTGIIYFRDVVEVDASA